MEIGERVRVVAKDRRGYGREGTVVHISHLASNPSPIGVNFDSPPAGRYGNRGTWEQGWFAVDELEPVTAAEQANPLTHCKFCGSSQLTILTFLGHQSSIRCNSCGRGYSVESEAV